jgi:hypothetical protein
MKVLVLVGVMMMIVLVVVSSSDVCRVNVAERWCFSHAETCIAKDDYAMRNVAMHYLLECPLMEVSYL